VRLPVAFSGRRALLWAVPLLVVLANLVWLSAFGSGSRLRARDLERRLGQARASRAAIATRLAATEKIWIAATENRKAIETVYRERFSTERARFTDQVRELKNLAERAGLNPAAIAYPAESLVDFGLRRRSFAFTVTGSYSALRTFLHLLDLSTSFLTVEQIAVAEAPGGLSIRLRLSTLFESVSSDAEAAEISDVEQLGLPVEKATPDAAPPGTPDTDAPPDDGSDEEQP
jgi:hypothetical protein